MSDNPFQSLLAALEPSAATSRGLVLGIVTSAAPLKVLVGGNTQEREDLMCSADLVANLEAEMTAQLTGSGSISGGTSSISGDASFTLSGSLRRRNVFKIGDRLLLLPIEDDQRYIIICKVVDI